jgi:DNA-directed RNA polymerase alpha subunit
MGQLEPFCSFTKMGDDEVRRLTKGAGAAWLQLIDIGMSVRADNGLRQRGLKYLGGLALLTRAEMARTGNIGAKTMKEYDEMLEAYGLVWSSKVGNVRCPKCHEFFSVVVRLST